MFVWEVYLLYDLETAGKNQNKSKRISRLLQNSMYGDLTTWHVMTQFQCWFLRERTDLSFSAQTNRPPLAWNMCLSECLPEMNLAGLTLWDFISWIVMKHLQHRIMPREKKHTLSLPIVMHIVFKPTVSLKGNNLRFNWNPNNG